MLEDDYVLRIINNHIEYIQASKLVTYLGAHHDVYYFRHRALEDAEPFYHVFALRIPSKVKEVEL